MYNNRISPRKMVRNKRDLKFSPRRNRPRSRTSISRIGPKPGSANTSSCANVKVVVRVRPPNQKELGNNSRTVVKVVENNVLIFDPKMEDEPFFYHGVQQRSCDLLKKANKNIQFVFDRVFGYEADNTSVFDHSTKNLIPSLMDGYNCSVFVYGATGAGKTHTMLGNNDNPGITFLTMRELFLQIEHFNNEREFELAITYLEVYNETVKDLLNPGIPLHLREDGKFGVCVSGIKVHRIKSPEELFALLEEGNRNRTQHPTDANAESSRSHAVFQVYVNMQFRTSGQRRIAKLSMIDLAGSERGAATGCSGQRFTEGANINKSLLALGNCINSLADGQRHIPYRDSKLTRILKDSLGGNCQTVMIANISPSNSNYEDTYNTLRYATRAKKIKSNSPQYQKIVEDLTKENNFLKEELDQIKCQNIAGSSSATCLCNENKENSQPTEEDTALQKQLQYLLSEKCNFGERIQILLNNEEILKYQIRLKKFAENIISDSCTNDENLKLDRNKIQNKVDKYECELRSIQAQIQDLKSQKRAVELKLQNIFESENVPTDKIDILRMQSEIDFKTVEINLQREHTNKFIDMCQHEVEQKEKMLIKMYDIFNNYYQLVRTNELLTESMAEDYCNVMRMARGLRTVTWLDDKEFVSDSNSQDSGISVNPTPNIEIMLSKLRINHFKREKSPGKRTTVKRKLYEVETKSTSAIETFIKRHLTNDSEPTTLNLNDTIVLAESINTDNINSTFSINDIESVVPKKKSALSDRNNDNMLPQVSGSNKSALQRKANMRTMNQKYRPPSSTAQKFPLKKNQQEKAKSSRSTKPTSSTMRFDRFKP